MAEIKEACEWCEEAVDEFLKKHPTVELTNDQKVDLVVILATHAEVQDELIGDHVAKESAKEIYKRVYSALRKAVLLTDEDFA